MRSRKILFFSFSLQKSRKPLVSFIMNPVLLTLGSVIGAAFALWLLSLLMEALRRAPKTPEKLRWAPEIPISYVDIDSCRVRYIKTGSGPNLVLLHTLRTQLDLFEKVIPNLAKTFTVYALDYPGHGYSDIPTAKYDADFFVASVEQFLNRLDLRNVTLAGVSIGASISFIIAARHNPRVVRAIAINLYDYDKGRGLGRSSFSARLTVILSQFPIVGETFNRLRNFLIVRPVLEGGVADPANFPLELQKEIYVAGNRRGHYRGFVSLLRNAESFERAAGEYKNITMRHMLIWGDKDWSRTDEREHDNRLVPAARVLTIEHGGHFLPLDQPDALIKDIKSFMASAAP
jgi:pimeloyl-ACP methyl ester carboxylesterase